jgi:hypothetical protein
LIVDGLVTQFGVVQFTPAEPDDFHRREQIDHIEAGRPDQHICLVDRAILRADPCRQGLNHRAGDERDVVPRQGAEPPVVQ